MADSNYFPDIIPRSNTFKLVMGALFLFSLLPLYSAIKGLEGKFMEGADPAFFYVLIVLIAVSLLSVISMYQFKKWAIFTFIMASVAQYIWYLIAYGIEFFDMVFVFFLFIGFGLFVIIPRWKYFK